MVGVKRLKFGARKRAAYLEALRTGSLRGAAAASVGVNRETVRRAYNEDAEFAAAVEQAELDANELVENALYQAAQAGNVIACQVWLYNRQPERWKDQRNLKAELTGKDGEPLIVVMERIVVNRPTDNG